MLAELPGATENHSMLFWFEHFITPFGGCLIPVYLQNNFPLQNTTAETGRRERGIDIQNFNSEVAIDQANRFTQFISD
jgi:hypothetical protein